MRYTFRFLAGADIKEMQPRVFSEVYNENFLCGWDRVAATRLPTIAAVNGFAVSKSASEALISASVYAALLSPMASNFPSEVMLEY